MITRRFQSGVAGIVLLIQVGGVQDELLFISVHTGKILLYLVGSATLLVCVQSGYWSYTALEKQKKDKEAKKNDSKLQG